MLASAITSGLLLCWRAPMPSESAPVMLRVIALEPGRLPSGRSAWWVKSADSQAPAGEEWLVPWRDLQTCLR